MEDTYLEYPTVQDLLPFMGLHVVAVPADRPPWGGTLIGISDKAHIRNESGQIAEFPLDETVFKCVRSEGSLSGASRGGRDAGSRRVARPRNRMRRRCLLVGGRQHLA